VNPKLTHLAHQLEGQIQRNPRLIGGVAGGIALLGAATYFFIRSRHPTAEELERRRRERVAQIGRITDGHITDARTLDGDDSISPTPEVLFYSYRLAGVTYNCAQDVSSLPTLVLGYRIDQPVQIRYDIRNPGNSIIVSESWSGLRIMPNSIHLPPEPVRETQTSRDFHPDNS
jgi:hypothetical protein